VAGATSLTPGGGGAGPGAINVLEVDDQSVQVSVLQWSEQERAFTRAIWSKFARSI
jgi:hypothetical protein